MIPSTVRPPALLQPVRRNHFRFFCDDADSVVLRTWMGEGARLSHARRMARSGCMTFRCPRPPAFSGTTSSYLPDGQIRRYGAPDDGLGGEGQEFTGSLHSFQLTVYRPSFKTPSFLHGANIYQIFPDRFFKAPTAAVDTRTDRRMHKDWDEDLYFKPEPGKAGQRLPGISTAAP